MSVITLNSIIHHFRIDDQTLSRRKEIGSYINSFSSLIVDRFFQALEEDDQLHGYLALTEKKRLMSQLNSYLCELFVEPFELPLIERMRHMAIMHYDTGLLPEHLGLGYELLRGIILELASVNDTVRSDLNVILKMLHVSEFVMHETYYLDTLGKSSKVGIDNENFSIVEKLVEAYKIHKRTMQQLLRLRTAKDPKKILPEVMQVVKVNPGECQATQIYMHLLEGIGEDEELSGDLSAILKEHSYFHDSLSELFDLIQEDGDEERLDRTYGKIDKLFEAFMKPADAMLQDNVNFMAMSINSAIAFMNASVRQMHATNLYDENGHLQFDDFVLLIIPLFEEYFGWCIDDVVISRQFCVGPSVIHHEIRLKYSSFYISITLREKLQDVLVRDILNLVLENIKHHLLHIEREKSLQFLADKAEGANKSKDIFLANMSHELRTPLNAIIGFSQILTAKQDIPKQYQTYLEKISIAGNNLLTLVNTILDFAKLEAGKFQFKPENVNTYMLIKEVTTIIEPLAGKKRINFEYPKFASHVIHLDAQLIKQVLINLLSNAIKFTPEEGSVTLEAVHDEDGDFHFTVCDNGVGIPKESQYALFEPFAQVDNPFQKSTQGTGLGLTISKKIVEDLHNGKIWVESEPGEGSCFHVTLPYNENDVFIETSECGKADAKRLLIVEDSKDYINILMEKLKDEYDLTITNSINQAKRLLEEDNRFDMGIYDFFLIDGISTEILHHMERSGIEFPILVISAERDYDLMRSFQASSYVEGIFNKDYINDVLDALNIGLGKRS